MRLSLDRKLYLILGSLFLLLLLIMGRLYFKNEDLRAAIKMRGHTNKILQSLKSLAVALYHAESQKRGYLVTGDASFRQDLREAIDRMLPVREELESLIEETRALTPVEQVSGAPYKDGIEALSSGFTRRMELLSSLLKMPRAVVLKNAPAEVRRGAEITSAIEGMMQSLEADMSERWEMSNIAVRARLSEVRWGIGTSVIFSALLLLFGAVQIRATFRSQNGHSAWDSDSRKFTA